WIGLLLAPCGVLGYLGYVALATGQLDGWGQIQRAGWASYLDGGASTAEFIRDALAGGSEVYDLAIVLALAASVVLVVLAIRTRVPWPLVVYGVLVPAFTLLLPVAIGLARRRTGTAVAVVAAAALASAWFGGYALTIWHYGIRRRSRASASLAGLWPVIEPACACSVGSLRVFSRLATVTTTSTARITPSESGVGISGNAGLMSVCAQCRISFTPMNARISARPVERYTSRSSNPATRKNSARRPSRANALAAKTMNGTSVTPKTAGIESSANSRSMLPMAISTMKSGVNMRLPSTFVTSLPSSYSSVTGSSRLAVRTTPLLSTSGSSSRCRNSCTAV